MITAVRDAFSPTAHPIYLGIAGGKLKQLQRDSGTFPSINFVFDDAFLLLEGKRDEVATLLAYMSQRFPHVPVQEIAITVKKI